MNAFHPSALRPKLIGALPAFEERNFRLYFCGQVISLAGTWMQNVAQGWLVKELTSSKFWLGMNAALLLGATALLAPLGGIVVDRFDKRKVLFMTNVLGMIQAFLLAWAVYTHHATLLLVNVLAFMLGLINSIDAPARRTFVKELATDDNMDSAVALNTTLVTVALFVGPMVAGICIATFGTAGAFLINGMTFPALLIALMMMNFKEHMIHVHPHPFKMLKEGFIYTFMNPTICILTVGGALILMCGFSYRSLFPAAVGEMFNGGPKALGFLYSGLGFGAMAGALFVSATSKKKNKLHVRWIMIIGSCIVSFGLYAFAMSRNLAPAFLFLFLAGAALIMSQTTAQAVIQKASDRRFLGRIMGINSAMFFGAMAIGNVVIGSLAQRFGCPKAIAINATAVAVIALVLFLLRNSRAWFIAPAAP